jgi:ATP-dependent Clp protease, protease subunit
MRIRNKSLFNKTKNQAAYRIENKAGETTVYIYDEISYWGVDAQTFVKEFNAIDSDTIHLRVNSPGGSVFDGTTIFNAIKQHKSKVTAHVDGLAASIASVIVLAADEVLMAENAFYMIHEPWSIMAGSADELRKEAELLEKVRGTIAKTYMDKTGKEEEEILALMAEETWMTAEEALEFGFIDSIYSPDEVDDKAKTLFDLTVFDNVPDKLKGKKEITAKDLEDTLRSAGCTQKQAKAIISEGFKTDQRDVAVKPDKKVVDKDQRDVALPKDLVTDLLVRAETMAPGNN